MKCKCGNDIKIAIGAKVKAVGCRILTAMTSIVTAECIECGEKFQIPITGKGFAVHNNDF